MKIVHGVCAVWAVVAFGAMASAQERAPALAALRASDAAVPITANRFALAEQVVEVQTEALFGMGAARGSGPSERVTLSLKAGVEVEALREARDLALGNTPVWYGELVDKSGGYALLVSGPNGEVAGKVSSPDLGLFEVVPVRPGVSIVRQVDAEALPGCGSGPAQLVRGAGGGERRGVVRPGGEGGGTGGGGGSASRGTNLYYVDILLVYTPAVLSQYGSVANVNAVLDAMMADANLAYQNSLVDLRVRTAGRMLTPGYIEDATDMAVDLNRLTSPSDGFMDEVHAERDALEADMVSLISGVANGACGIGWLMTSVGQDFQSNAFNVTASTCISNLTFHHELGHNMGLAHDRANAGGASHPFAYGYRTPDNAYRTVMAYAPGQRLNFFSNPTLSFNGRALGNPVDHPTNAAYNALALNLNADTVSLWRGGFEQAPGTFELESPAPGAVVTSRRPFLSWSIAFATDHYVVEIDTDAAFGSPEVVADPVTGTSFQPAAGALQPATQYFWRVTAVNPLGTSLATPGSSSFFTPSVAPGAFQLSQPEAGAASVSLTPNFLWTGAEDVDTYWLQVDDDPAFTSPVIDRPNLTGAGFQSPGTPLAALTTYFWRVTATNPNGTTASTPASRSFTTVINPPAASQLQSPADGVNIATASPTLVWAAGARADTYRVQVDNDQSFATPEVDASGLAATSFAVPAGVLLNNTRYYWRVYGVNVAGSTISSPAVRSFGVLVPACPGDATGDRVVSFDDITSVLANFGATHSVAYGPGDANGNRTVSFDDVTSVLSNFGDVCP